MSDVKNPSYEYDRESDCHRCFEERSKTRPVAVFLGRMILCPLCGNKRCPKASDHRLDCSGSNEPGQLGSLYCDASAAT